MTSCGIRNILEQYTEFREISRNSAAFDCELRGIPCIFAYGIPNVLHGHTQILLWGLKYNNKVFAKLYYMEKEA
jgi:hypothetical protein